MKTVSTKLNKEDFEKFQEMCNQEGQCMSEQLRDLIKMGINAYDDEMELESNQTKEPSKPIITITEVKEKPNIISHGKILDDNGNIVGTF